MMRIIIGVIVLSIFYASYAQAQNFNIGVLAYDGKQQALNRWKPTADYLSKHIPAAAFNIVPLTHQEFEHAINKGELEFVLTNPGHYVRLELKFGVTRIATFLTQYQQTTLKQFSSVIFTRTDSTLEKVTDLSGKTLAAVNEQAFGGFQLAQDTLLNEGIDVLSEMQIKWMGFPHSDVVMAVINGLADAGTVRSGILEKMAHKNLINLQDIRVIRQQQHQGFPLLHSVDLFPEWPFSKLPKTDTGLAKKVAISLYQMSADSAAAKISGGSGWTTPLNYAQVHDVLRRLKVDPYQAQMMELPDVLKSYREWIIGFFILLMIMSGAVLHLFRSNQKLLQAQRSVQKHQEQIEENLQQRTDELLQTNQTLQIEMTSHAETEQVLRLGSETLQAIYGVFMRNDLDRPQKLNSVVEAVRQYLGMEFAMLSTIESGHFTSSLCSPGLTEKRSPLSLPLAQQACEENQILVRENTQEWSRYAVCPVSIEEEQVCLFEFASSHSYENEKDSDNEMVTSELCLSILHLVSLWVSNENRLLDKQQQAQHRNIDVQHRFEQLSPREKEVLQLLMTGESTKEMARILNISSKTVEMHRANLLRKTQAKSSTELVQLAVISGLFDNT